MKKSLLIGTLLSSLLFGCSSTEIQESMGLNAPFPELTSQTAELSAAAR